MRGRKAMVTAVRRPGGELAMDVRALAAIYTGWMRRTPLMRGIIVLIEAMVLGISALLYSANVSLEEEEEDVVELWMVEKRPVPLKEVVPRYPESARRAGVEGKVAVTILVGKSGKVEKIGEIEGPAVFHAAARQAALQWTFLPAVQNDQVVRVWVRIPFNFQFKVTDPRMNP